MALIPIYKDRTEKPPFGTPLRSDGHWSVQGIKAPWIANESAGRTVFDGVGGGGYTLGGNVMFNNDGRLRFPGGANTDRITVTGAAVPSGNMTVVVGCMRAADTIYDSAPGKVQQVFTLADNPSSSVSIEFNLGNGFGALGDINKPRASVISGGGTLSAAYLDGKLQASANPFPTALNNGQYYSVATVWASLPQYSNMWIGAGTTYALNGGIDYFYWYSRALSASEVASLSANPWQIYEPEIVWINVGGGGGPTSVSSNLTITWDMFQSVNSDLSVKWDLLNSVQSDLSIKFDILNSVFADLSIPWDVYQTVNGDLAILFDIRNTVQSDLQILWDSAGVVFSDLTIKWDLGNLGGRITIIGSGFRRIIG